MPRLSCLCLLYYLRCRDGAAAISQFLLNQILGGAHRVHGKERMMLTLFNSYVLYYIFRAHFNFKKVYYEILIDVKIYN